MGLSKGANYKWVVVIKTMVSRLPYFMNIHQGRHYQMGLVFTVQVYGSVTCLDQRRPLRTSEKELAMLTMLEKVVCKSSMYISVLLFSKQRSFVWGDGTEWCRSLLVILCRTVAPAALCSSCSSLWALLLFPHLLSLSCFYQMCVIRSSVLIPGPLH